jgi:hypothetical protein
MATTIGAPSRWSDAQLDAMRHHQDPPADALVSELFAKGEVDAVNALMKTLSTNGVLPPNALPTSVRDFIESSSALPPWADAAKIATGEHLFWRYGPGIIANLHCYSLPFCYAARKGVQALDLTSRLYSNPTRRIIETAQMVVDVMRPGGLGSLGTGIHTAQRVRLMHAGVRFQIGKYPGWQTAEFDLPLNQEDMAGTILAFSFIVLDGLRKLGHELTAEEIEAYLHCWNVVGYLIGLCDDLMAHNYAEASELAGRISGRQFTACPEGQRMTSALIEMMQHIVPGRLFDHVPALMVRFLFGDHGADLLAVAPGRIDHLLTIPIRIAARISSEVNHDLPVVARVHELFSRALIQGIIFVEREGKQIPFAIPTELLQTWGVNWLP